MRKLLNPWELILSLWRIGMPSAGAPDWPIDVLVFQIVEDQLAEDNNSLALHGADDMPFAELYYDPEDFIHEELR